MLKMLTYNPPKTPCEEDNNNTEQRPDLNVFGTLVDSKESDHNMRR